jgi:RNA polymerase sigma factor (sigma-70 family)
VDYVEYDDIRQQGVLALYAAIKGLDHLKGEFSTYAYLSIHRAIVDYVLRNAWELNSRGHRRGERLLAQIRSEFKETYGREPTPDEISGFGNISLRRVNDYEIPSIRLLHLDQAAYEALDQTTEQAFEEMELLTDLHQVIATYTQSRRLF